jgi:nucleoside 2-deoxyribosyltransferase
MNQNNVCYICNSIVKRYGHIDGNNNQFFYECEICGKYGVDYFYFDKIDKDIFAHFLYHNNLKNGHLFNNKFTYYYGSQESFESIYKKYKYIHLLNDEEIEAWYPINFSEKIDIILLSLAKLSDYLGSVIDLSNEQTLSLYFVKRYLLGKETSIDAKTLQINTFADYMFEQKFIWIERNKISVLPEGWKRIDELQKNQIDRKQVFVAIAFSENMQKIQEAIEVGIRRAGYIPHVMNKIEHNNQIVPEILYQIRQSKFIVAEFSTNNNGAYYEAGYAAGLGKEVIHICNDDKFHEEGHFDIKQKSTVLWKIVDDIPEALFKRIEATIGKSK